MRVIEELFGQVDAAEITAAADRLAQLTTKEREILRAVIHGETAADSAARLGVSRRTVELHRQHLLSKLKARNIVEVVAMIARVERTMADPVPRGELGKPHAGGLERPRAVTSRVRRR